MKATMSALLCAPLLATGLAAQHQVQNPNQPKVSARRLVDVSVEGLGEAPRRTPGDTTRGSSVGLSARRSPGGLDTPFDCLESIADQATGGCLTASSTPTLGLLYPYPGLNNVFVPQAFVGGGEDNLATGPWSTVGGGRFNSSSYYHTTVGGGAANTASGVAATVGGGSNNIASGRLATVAGGGGFFGRNTASGNYATVGGGLVNDARGRGATVGGGANNTASGDYATVAGGGSFYGDGNDATGDFATVGGGQDNVASGIRATVPGGHRNEALGNHSFAAGRRAKANHNGAFVWGDTQNVDKPSSGPDQFTVYCRGGARFFSNPTFTTGVLLAAGGSTWTMVSDRDAKENVKPVDARSVLDEVSQLPLATWNYKAQDDSIRHMGPMAQDFYAAFGLGLGDKTIDTIDPNGVALAAIQGLNAVVQAKDAVIADHEARIEQLSAANEALLARVERLEALTRR